MERSLQNPLADGHGLDAPIGNVDLETAKDAATVGDALLRQDVSPVAGVKDLPGIHRGRQETRDATKHVMDWLEGLWIQDYRCGDGAENQETDATNSISNRSARGSFSKWRWMVHEDAQSDPNALADMLGLANPNSENRDPKLDGAFSPSCRNRSASGSSTALSFALWLRKTSQVNLSPMSRPYLPPPGWQGFSPGLTHINW
jgi:hypothetical protein